MDSEITNRQPMTPVEARVYRIVERHVERKPHMVLRQSHIARKMNLSAVRVHDIVSSLIEKRWLKRNSSKNLARAI